VGGDDEVGNEVLSRATCLAISLERESGEMSGFWSNGVVRD
jgi:hypothetical protein